MCNDYIVTVIGRMETFEPSCKCLRSDQFCSGVGAGPVSLDKSGPLFGSFCVAHVRMKR